MEIPIPPIPIYISHHIVYKWIIIPFTSSIYHQQKPHLVVSLSLSYPTKHTRIYPAIHLGQPDVPDGGWARWLVYFMDMAPPSKLGWWYPGHPHDLRHLIFTHDLLVNSHSYVKWTVYRWFPHWCWVSMVLWVLQRLMEPDSFGFARMDDYTTYLPMELDHGTYS